MDRISALSFYDYGTLLEFRHKFPTIFIGKTPSCGGKPENPFVAFQSWSRSGCSNKNFQDGFHWKALQVMECAECLMACSNGQRFGPSNRA